ncbi:MAG: MOSC domain-containing protein [Actinomycetota bacterium]
MSEVGVRVVPLNAALDGQGDRENHGDPKKAVCVYPFDHYACWERGLDRRLAPRTFSENLTVSRAPETKVCIGDVFRAEEAAS